jgi:6-pyruvoyltetrahydropterin/6-carboxytetrahydropterin synthase
MKSSLIVCEEFAAAHLYRQKNWDPAKNAQVFGKCYSEYGHGHNYRLEVGFTLSSQALQTSTTDLNQAVSQVCALLDHKHLNFVVPEFLNTVPTTENIALYLLKKLQEACPKDPISYIKLFETDTLWVEIHA